MIDRNVLPYGSLLYEKGKLIVVFGCGGDRDRGKRAEMAAVAEQYCSKIVLTNDNPRFEDPQRIINDIVEGFSSTELPFVEYDRARAIAHAITEADQADIVLVAGKGHETEQWIGDEKRRHSDVEQVEQCLARRRSLAT